MNLSLFSCSHCSLAALLSACGTPACVNVIATRSGFPQDGAALKNASGTYKEDCRGGKREEWEKGRNFECVFWGREEEGTGEELEWEGAKALTDCHSMYP